MTKTKDRRYGITHKTKFNDLSPKCGDWTNRKLIRLARKYHADLTRLDKEGEDDYKDIITHDAMVDALNQVTTELEERGYWVDGINDPTLVIQKEADDE